MTKVTGAHIELTGDAKQLDAALNTAQQELRQTGNVAEKTRGQLRGLGVGMNAASKQVRRARNSYKGFSGGVRNASFQLADFAVMVDGGMGASRAFATQLPQLLGGMGLFGAALGAVVAIGFPLGGVLADAAAGGADVAGAFGVLEPLLVSMASAFKVLGDVAVNSINFLINNLDQVIITAGVAAVAFGGPLVASFVAAKVATMTLSGALAFLKKALIRTGIGAIIIGVGYLIERFATLSQRVGGISGAFALLTDVVVEEMDRIGARVAAIFTSLKITLTEFERDAAKTFQEFMPDAVITGAKIIIRTFNAIKEVALSVFGAVWSAAMGEGFQLPDIGAAITRGFTSSLPAVLKGAEGIRSYDEEIERLYQTLGVLEGAAIAPRVALERLRALMAEDGSGDFDIRGMFGGGDSDDPDSEANRQKEQLERRLETLKQALFKETSTEMEILQQKTAMRQAILDEAFAKGLLKEQEHKEQLLLLEESYQNDRNKITQQGEDLRLAAVGQTFGAMAGLMQAGGKKMLGIAKVFGATEALINAYRAFNATLADPILPWYMRIPKAVAVLGAGLQTVNAIRGAGSGGGGAGRGAASAGGSAEPAPVSRNVAISLAGGDMFGRDQVVGLINQINEAVEDGAVVRLA